ncbi:MAG: Hsp20/alpha crystallin family protein [Candidatus Lokiarchaeota archaeon]|nr:Hsp20/alpha crystallin family protein [Candidatus Lokiarchaeota archaeon]
MNENQDEEEVIDLEEKTESNEQILEKQKKLEEITLKRTETSHFKTQNPESLEIMENEPFYRVPLTDIIESKDVYYILVELPGLDKKNVKISLQEGILELLGEKTIKDKEKKEEKKEKEKDKKEKKDEKKDKDKKKEKYKEIKGEYLRREIRTTNFFRCFQLPEDITPEEIDASFKNGILQLRIPKKSAGISDKKVIEIK